VTRFKKFFVLTGLSSGSALLALASPAWPQAVSAANPTYSTAEKLQEVTVTAERRPNRLQKTSVSVATVSGREIDRQGLQSLDQVAKEIPNVVITASAVGFSATMRGVGASPVPAGLGGAAGISTLYDGIYSVQEEQARSGFYDVVRFEVLLGPQGTLYGHNAEGGVFNIISNDPTNRLEGNATIEVGNYNLVRGTLVLNVPLTDQLAVRVAGTSVNRDGYLTNGQDDDVATSGRLKLQYKPSDQFKLLLAGEFTKLGGKGFGTVVGATYPLRNPWTSPNPSAQSASSRNYRLWANLVGDVGIGDLTVIPAFQHDEEHEYVYTGLNDDDGENPAGLTQRSIEARLSSKPSAPFVWQAGSYLYDSDQSSNGQTTMLSGVSIVPTAGTATATELKASNGGVFAQVTVPITPTLRVIAGVRESRDSSSIERAAEIPPAVYPLTKGSWDHFDWKAGLEYGVTPNSMLYSTVATGYRPGGFGPIAPNPYGLESLRSYEIGAKNEFLDHHLRVNAALYWYTYKNYQVVTFVPNAALGMPAPDVINVPNVADRGGELDTEWLVTSYDTITASVGYADTKVEGNAMAANPETTFPFIDINGESLQNSPTWTAHASFSHSFILPNQATIVLEPDLQFSSAYHVTAAATAGSTQSAYAQENASATYTPADERWSLNLYGRNLSNKAIKSAYYNLGPSGTVYLLQPPRTFGVTLNAKF